MMTEENCPNAFRQDRSQRTFLGIVSSNVDELYMVRMASLRREARGHDADGDEPADDGLDEVAGPRRDERPGAVAWLITRDLGRVRGAGPEALDGAIPLAAHRHESTPFRQA